MKSQLSKNNFNLLRLIIALQIVFIHSILSLGIENLIVDNIYNTIKYIPGVAVFFLISGFLIAMSYDKNPNLKYYIKNRILRIYPALFINIFIGIIILYYFDFIEFNTELILWIMAQITFLQFYNIDMFREFGVGVINGSLWTISVELAFYILLPIIFIVKVNF